MSHKCPVCQMDIKESLITGGYKGKHFKFCCDGCKAKFDINPDKYV